MPELPEVECLRRSLEPHLLGRTVASAKLLRADMLTFDPAADRSEAVDTSALLLQGARVTHLDRRGKQLAIHAESRKGKAKATPILIVQLGMTGQMLMQPASPSAPFPKHTHATWTLDSGCTLLFRDPRRFGALSSLTGPEALDRRWADLGPDALTIQPDALRDALTGSARPIKSALLDQAALAGVGNIYADEALFLSGISPTRPAKSLKGDDFARLASSIREVLRTSIDAGGSTLRDYLNADSQPGSYQTKKWVYGRAGEPCLRCGAKLKSASVAQRTTTWCPRCQQRKGS